MGQSQHPYILANPTATRTLLAATGKTIGFSLEA
jgi:hypothetical protein